MKYKFIAFIILVLLIFGLLMNTYINTDNALSNIKDKIIRLHVVANSDSPHDQAIKLNIRDAIIKDLSPMLCDLIEPEKAKSIIADNLDKIKETAENELERLGEKYDITVDLGIHEFPTKIYGNLSFPAGEYQALNVVIGEGGGKNWWCVMFPPLCFVDIAQGVLSEQSLEELKEVLSQEEIDILKSDKEETSVKMKFKIAEIYKKLNSKVAKIIGKNREN